jgi:hydroxymethylglutaryl-CoA reductase (NADPH)
MDLRNLPEQLSSIQRINQRRTLIEREFGMDLSALEPKDNVVGEAEKKNCEQMFGVVPVPVGYAGPLSVVFSNGTKAELHLPLATTEGALVASVNRGCKAASASGITITKSVDHGITRSIAFRAASSTKVQELVDFIRKEEKGWKAAAQATSSHLAIKKYDLDIAKQFVFLTIACDTGDAMGMNMVTIAAQAAADFIVSKMDAVKCVTVAGNVDSDKKPSRRTHERGRGFEVIATVLLSKEVIEETLKSSADAMAGVANAKLKAGSELAGAIGKNLHAANILAALYLSTGQDIAHTVEGSLADTEVEATQTGLKIQVRLPAIIVGTHGGGTALPAQMKCREMLLKNKSGMIAKQQLAECIAAAVLAGEISLLAAQASGELAQAHKSLAR